MSFNPLWVITCGMIKKVVGSTALLLFLSMPVFAVSGGVVSLEKKDLEKPELYTGKIETLNGSMLIKDSETLSQLIDEQKKTRY